MARSASSGVRATGFLFTALLTAVAIQASAQTDGPTKGPAERIAPDAVLSAATLDLNGDGVFDRAVLVEGEDGADLYLYLSPGGRDARGKRELALFKRGAAWAGTMWGTLPSLSASAKGSLLLQSGNDAVGRSRWQQTLTIAYRDGTFVVAGLTHASRDTLDPSAGTTCDLNYLTGQGTRNGKRLRIQGKPVTLADWNGDAPPKECQ